MKIATFNVSNINKGLVNLMNWLAKAHCETFMLHRDPHTQQFGVEESSCIGLLNSATTGYGANLLEAITRRGLPVDDILPEKLEYVHQISIRMGAQRA